ncbi:B3 domain-containing protein Os01g0905400-like [Curcuma longa]|uniref:B3 domain-containing protein Os01g0905400-like n=1 Tax=Curcuma longa TaxID=136217 RepID=UPI003D9DDE3B
MAKKKPVCKEGVNECSNKKMRSSCSSAPHFPCHPPPVHPSFCKIMIGDFQEFLFIPPDFTKVVVDLVEKNVYLKTSLGSCFKVKLSVVNKSLAFKDGWPDFVLDHSVAAKDFLTFTYVSKSLFCVDIFGRNACERVYFGKTDGNILKEKKKEKADTSLRRPQLVKGQKSFEAPSLKKESLEKTDPLSTNKNVSKCLGGTEVHFGKMSDNLYSRKNRRKADSSPERTQLVKKPHFLEASNVKKRSEEINDPTISANCSAECLVQNNNESGNSARGIEMMDDPDYGCVAKNPDKVEKKPKFPPPHSCGSGSPRDVVVIQMNKPSANMILGEVPIEDEERGHSFVHETNKKQISSCQDVILVTPEVDVLLPSADMILGEVPIEDEERGHSFVHETNKKQISSCRDVILVTPEVDVLLPSDINEMYHLGENESDYLHEQNVMNAIAADEIVGRFLLTEDGVCHIVEDDIENGGCKANIIKKYHAGENGNGIGGINTIADEEVVCKFLITENGICHIVSEDITHGQGAATNTNVTGNGMGCIDTVNMPRDASSTHESSPADNSLAPVIQHINDQTANRIVVNKKRSRTGCSYTKRLTSSLDSFEGNRQDMPYMTTESNQLDNNLQDIPDGTATANQSGKVSDILLEVNGEEDESCLRRSHDPKSAEVKPTGLDGVFSLSSPCFSLTLSSNYQFYIELPHRLQLPRGRKRTETKIVVLRDPCLRLWPVMYHETDRFTGFVAGWNDFVKANNLQQGHHCNVFSIGNKKELLFHVQIAQQ